MQAAPVQRPSDARFGGAFAVDFRTGELRKHGIRIRLQEQPFIVLAALLETPGELVSREELKRRLWRDEAFTDFDHGINVAVKKLRAALNDSAASPRYIETLARKGYRFIAPVEIGAVPIPSEEPPALPQTARQRKWLIAGSLAAAVLLALGALRPQPPLKISLVESGEGFIGQPAISPDGTRIVFSHSQEGEPRKLFLKTLGAGPSRRLTDDQDPEHGETDPLFMSSGDSISFIRRGPTRGLFSAPANGGAPTKLLDLGPAKGYSWAPDGRTIVAALVDDDGVSRIYSVAVPSGARKRLSDPGQKADHASPGDFNPRFSPDGSMIAFLRNGVPGRLMTMPASGGEPRVVVRGATDLAAYGVYCWTRDSLELIYASMIGANSNLLYRVAVDHGRPAPLPFAAPGLDIAGPITAPRSNRLVYEIPSQMNGIWRFALRSRGAESAARLIESGRVVAAPSWSPDRRRIVFASSRTGSFEIYTADRDGSRQAQLTFTGRGMNGWPRWSPDGRRIAYDGRPGNSAQIFVVDAEGGTPKALTAPGEDAIMPEWSPDGRWVYYTVLQSDGGSNIWRVPSTGGAETAVTSNNAYGAYLSPDASTLYFMRRSDQWLYSMPVSGGAEEKLVDGVNKSCVSFVRSGVYFLSETKAGRPDNALTYYSFATRKREIVLTFPRPASMPALAVSADEREVLYAENDFAVWQIMLVDNFR